MTVTLVTTWDIPCGIAEYAHHLIAWLGRVVFVHPETLAHYERSQGPATAPDPGSIYIEPDLHPRAVLESDRSPGLLHLNYQAALHSQWTPTAVVQARDLGWKVLITYHDSGVPNAHQCKALHAVADAFVVHEPVDDLPGAYYWRQGVPAAVDRTTLYRDWPGQPLVGTLGFPFPWKNYDLLVDVATEAGWKPVLIAPDCTDESAARWRRQGATVYPTFLHRDEALAILSGCDATAFLYSCANTGTSGAIRQGLATRKTVIAADGCRQFRDLVDPAGTGGILWTGLDRAALLRTFTRVHLGLNPGIVYLAHRDSWRQLAARYAALYEELGA